MGHKSEKEERPIELCAFEIALVSTEARFFWDL